MPRAYSKRETREEHGVSASTQRQQKEATWGPLTSKKKKMHGSVLGNQDQYNPQAKERTALHIKLGIKITLEGQKLATTSV